MEQTIINEIVQGMLPFLDNRQMEELQKVLEYTLYGKTVVDTQPRSRETTENENRTLMTRFIAAKRIEGCSEKSLKYYSDTIGAMLGAIGKAICQITTDDLRG